MSDTNNNQDQGTRTRTRNAGPSRSGRHRHNRVGKKKKIVGDGTRNSSGADDSNSNSKWRRLDPDYRKWLVERGIAEHAAAFNALSDETRISASASFEAKRAAEAKTTEQVELANLTSLLRLNLISQANPYAAISDSHYSQQDSEIVRANSIAYYGLPSEKYCQILGQQPEQIKIVNAHIWPRSGTAMLSLFGLETGDIHSPRNVLRLHKCIERAFDRRELTIVASSDAGGQLVVKVLNNNIFSVLLKGTQVRFSDIDGVPLKIGLPGVYPYRRLLAHHSVLSHRYAREKGWITEDLVPEEVSAGALMEYSLDQQAQDRIKLLWQQQQL